MKRLYPYAPVLAACVAAACAAGTAGNSNFQQQNASTGDAGSGASSAQLVVLPTSDASINVSLRDAAAGPDADDSGLSLGADGSVVGTCVVGRTCDPTCDELQEDIGNGPVHTYIEPKPDDGSALPTMADEALFAGTASTTGGPCIIDPPNGALFPNNWLRPRIFFNPASATQTIFQIRIHANRQMNDLVVYTKSRSWEIPKDIWTALAKSTWSEDITVTVSAAAPGGAPASSQVSFQIAPALANGSMIYWAAVGDTNGYSWLEGFGIADEGVSTVLTVPTGPYANAATNTLWTWSRDSGGNLSVQNRDTNTTLPTGDAQCIGCHVAVPDQVSVAFLDFYPWDGVASSVAKGTVGQQPAWMTPGGAETLSQGGLGMMSFSSGVWQAGQHLVVAATQVPENATQAPWNSINGDTNPSNLIWIDLATAAAPTFVNGTTPLGSISVPVAPYYANKGTTYGYIDRTGDTNSASSPAWSHDGTKIVYASNTAPKSGRLDVGVSDLYVVPFNATTKMGGPAAKLQGASIAGVNEYYPAFSPDDKYVAYNSAPPMNSMYYNVDSEVDVVPSAGGTAVRLSANDPPACQTLITGQTPAKSPGVTNSWPRWSPEFPTCGGKTYYWLIFSSSRLGLPFLSTTNPKNFKTHSGGADGGAAPVMTATGIEMTSQLYLTALVDDGSATPQSFPATYIWNQPITSGMYNQSNHTPAWEVVEIQAPTPVPPPPPPPPPR